MNALNSSLNNSAINMLTMTLNEICKALDARPVGVDSSIAKTEVYGVNTDSRTLKPGEIFIALKGENFDAHDYISSAHTRGAVAYILEREIEGVQPALIVDDTRIALGKLAHAWRNRFSFPFVAITGSNGKTTVKEMVASILSTQGSVLATQGNFNNDIGVPLTLYRLSEHHDSAVIEMGANHQYEISYLTNLVCPDVAIITNAAAAHLEGFGSLEGVAIAKGEIFEGLNNNGIAILNADDDKFNYWKTLIGNKKYISFGKSSSADVTYKQDRTGMLTVQYKGSDKFSFELALLGRHNILNALAAIAASIALGIDYKNIKSGLENMKAVPGRLEKKKGINNSTVIDDTYNANPDSLKAAINVTEELSEVNTSGTSHIVIGDMGELGSNAAELHTQIADVLTDTQIEFVYTLGQYSENICTALTGRVNKESKKINTEHFTTHQELTQSLHSNVKANDIVLVKGSRSMHMEKIVQAICLDSVGDSQKPNGLEN